MSSNKIRSFHIRNIYIYRIEPVLGKILSKIFAVLFDVKNAIIFESHNDFDMNSGALYDYIRKQTGSSRYKMIWFVEHVREEKRVENVIQIPKRGFNLKRYYWNAVARYIFFDDSSVEKYRSDQICIYLGHATRAMKNVKGKVPIPKCVDFVCSSSEHNDELMSEVYVCDIKKMVHTGFPVTDWLYKKWNEISKIKVRVNYRKIIVWMPTFRKSMYNHERNDSSEHSDTGLSLIRSQEDYFELDEWLKQKGVLLIIKFHPAQDMMEIHIKDKENIVLMSPEKIKELDINTYKLLTQTDALISDYSSVSFDYLIVDRPIAYVVSDYDSYKPGFAANNPEHYMPGEYIYTKDDLLHFIDEITRGIDNRKKEREAVRNEIAKYNDGHVCERITQKFKIL